MLESIYIKIKAIVESPIFTDLEKIGMLDSILRITNVINETPKESSRNIIDFNNLLTSVNRVELIDKTGRVYHTQTSSLTVSLQLQDNNQTLKIIIN